VLPLSAEIISALFIMRCLSGADNGSNPLKVPILFTGIVTVSGVRWPEFD
jgi:hypothetical protein